MGLVQGGLAAASHAAGGDTTKTTSTVTPNLNPLQQTLENQILQSGSSNLNQDPDLRGYTANAIQQNNQQATQYGNVLNTIMAARGLVGSPTAAAAQSTLAAQNYKSNTDTLNQVPLLRQQLFQQKLASTAGAFKSTPYGLTQNTTSTKGTAGSAFLQGLSGGFSGGGGSIPLGGGMSEGI